MSTFNLKIKNGLGYDSKEQQCQPEMNNCYTNSRDPINLNMCTSSISKLTPLTNTQKIGLVKSLNPKPIRYKYNDSSKLSKSQYGVL
jgi:hypothetical protein